MAVEQPVLVLAGEPTSGLDPRTANAVMNALRSCAERGAAVLLVTHDPSVAGTRDRRYALDEGVLSATPGENARKENLGRAAGAPAPGSATDVPRTGRCPRSPSWPHR